MPRRLAALAAVVLLAFAWFAPALAGGRLFMPLHTEPLLPWRADADPAALARLRAAGNAELSDQLWLLLPGAAAAADAVAAGAWPTWNPAVAGGVPLLGLALDGALHPPNQLLWRFLPPERALAWNAALHLAVAALGAAWLARRLALPYGAALLAGALFATAGALAVRFHYPMTVQAACYVPWLLAAVHAFTQRPGALRLAVIPPPVALIVLCGFPQTGLYGIAGAAAWGTLRLLHARGRAALPALGALAGGFVLGLALAAPQVLAVDAAVPRSLQRAHAPAQQQAEAATPAALLGLVAPGTFIDGQESWSLDFGRNPLWNALYARTRPLPPPAVGAEPVGHGSRPYTTEVTCYLGALAVGLSLAALAARRRAGLGTALGLFAALLLAGAYLLGAPWVVQAVAQLPRFDIGDVRRILPTIALLHALLVACGAARFVAADGGHARRLAVGTTAAITVALLALTGWLRQVGPTGLGDAFRRLQESRYGAEVVAANAAMTGRSPELDAAIHAFVSGHAWCALAWFAGATLLLLLAALLVRRGRPHLALAAIAAFALADLGTLHFRVNRFLPADRFAAPLPALAPLAAAESGGRVRRYAPDWRPGDDMIERLPLPPNLGSLFGLLDGEGYLVMLPTRYARWLRALEPEAAPGDTAVTVAAYPLHQRAALRSPLLTGSSVRHLLSRHDVVAELVADDATGTRDSGGWRERLPAHGEWRIFENDRAAPLAFVVAEARFLPPPPADDAIGTAAEGFAPPIAADSAARAAWH
ncbi:MAG: hypothetical protein FJ293_11490, partial [Planctomycetes bacterium]|nr:hypothetical protein [Planctomycetota bacterium]